MHSLKFQGSQIYAGHGSHLTLAQYCQKLHNGDLMSMVPDSPLQLMAEIDAEQRHQLELMIRELETENANLQVLIRVYYSNVRPLFKCAHVHFEFLMNDFVERAVFFNGRSTYKLKRANLALEG